MANTLSEFYIPNYSELSETQLADARERLEVYLKEYAPDIDTRPGSVFGDLFLSPAADTLAALEEAIGRFISDLDLENAAAGNTYNCDLVRSLLENLAVSDTEGQLSQGVVRFLFTANGPYFIDRGIGFFVGDTKYTMRLPYDGGLTIKQLGSPVEAGQNMVPLRQVSTTLYCAEVVIEGAPLAGEEAAAGQTFEIDRTVAGLETVEAVADFSAYGGSVRIVDLAKKARRTVYSASMNSRGSARNMLLNEFPALQAASVVLTGDDEMSRDSVNALGFGAGFLDAYIKGASYGVAQDAIVRLPYQLEQGGDVVELFVGKLALPSAPIHITAIEAVSDPTVNLGLREGRIKIFSKSLNSVRAPMASCAYSNLEEIYISIPLPRDPYLGTPLISPSVLASGAQYADFRISYLADPMREAVAMFAEGPSAAVGVDTLVRSFLPVVIDKFEVRYVKTPGTTFNPTQARENIYSYMLTVGGEDAVYSDSRIYDIMYWAGTKDVRDIVTTANVRWSLADYYIKPAGELPTVSLEDALDEAVFRKTFQIANSRALVPQYVDPNIGQANETFEAIGPRNVSYVLLRDAISFTEIR